MSENLIKHAGLIDMSMSAANTIEYKLLNQHLPAQSTTDSMKEVVNFLKSTTLKTIETPFNGTCLQVTKDEKKIIFTSRAKSFIQSSSIKRKESRLAVVDLASEEVVLDKTVSEKDVLALEISTNDEFILAGGSDFFIFKYLLSDLTLLEKFSGHSDNVNEIAISSNNNWFFSVSSDGSARMWSLDSLKPGSMVLVQSSSSLNALDLSFNQKFLIAGGKECILYVYKLKQSLENSGKIIQAIQNDSEIFSAKISKKSSFLVFGDVEGKVKAFSFETWNVLHEFNMTGLISDLDVSANEEVLIAGSKNTDIKIWYLKTSQEINYDGHSGWVKRCKFIQGDTKIISISDDRKIRIWKIPETETENLVFYEKNTEILEIWFSRFSEKLKGIVFKDFAMFCYVWDEYGTVQSSFKLSSERSVFHVSFDHDLVFCCCEAASDEYENTEEFSSFIDVFEVSSSKRIKKIPVRYDLTIIHLSKSQKFLVLCEKFRFRVLNYISLEELQLVYFARQDIFSLCFDGSEHNLYMIGRKHLYNYSIHPTSVKEKCYKTYPSESISATLLIFDDSQFLYVLTSEFFELIHCESFLTVLKLNESFVGGFSNLNHSVFLYSQEFFVVLSKETFQVLTRTRKKRGVIKVELGPDCKNLYLIDKEKIFCIRNPLNQEKLTLVGDYKEVEMFQSYIDLLTAGKCESCFKGSLWLIEPVHVSLMHLYAFLNMDQLIKDAFKVGTITNLAFFKSREGFSPLTIALKMKFYESVNAIVKSIIKIVQNSPSEESLHQFLFQVIEDDLCELNQCNYKGLHKLYKSIYVLDSSYYLPNFCSNSVKLPVFHLSQYFFIDSHEFGLSFSEDMRTSKPIIFKKTRMKFSLQQGSTKSIEFLKSLSKCSNHKIFETEFIRKTLNKKWENLRWFMYSQALIYLCYLVSLSLFVISSDTRSADFLWLPFLINFLLYSYEFVFIYLLFLEYFKDIWNIVDTFRSLLTIVYCVCVWSGYFQITAKNTSERFMLSVLLLVSWIRGITYFRINKSTRYLNKLLFRACREMASFLVILFYSVLAFALAFRALNSDPKAEAFNSLTDSYMIIIGSWKNTSKPDFFSLVLLLATLFNPIITLNLLIAILSDTFETVKETQVVADAQELISMIIELETLMFWKRDANHKDFVHVAEDDSDENLNDFRFDMMIKNLRTKIFLLDEAVKKHEKGMEKFKEGILIHSRSQKEVLSNFNR